MIGQVSSTIFIYFLISLLPKDWVIFFNNLLIVYPLLLLQNMVNLFQILFRSSAFSMKIQNIPQILKDHSNKQKQYWQNLNNQYFQIPIMDQQAITEQITINNKYCVELSIQAKAVTIRLIISVSSTRKDIYHLILNEINQVQQLAEYFADLQKLIAHIRDPNNIEVDVDKKTITVLKSMNIEGENSIGQLGVLFLTLSKVIDTQSKQTSQIVKVGTASNFIDQQCQDFKRLIINGSIMTSKQLANIFGKKRLIGQSKFSATFSKIDHYVSIGVIDAVNKYGKWNSNYAFYFDDGDCRIAGKKQGKSRGYKVGQKVTVVVNLKKQLIQWKVGEQIRHEIRYEMLNDLQICWVPFIGLYKKGDSVEINQE